LTGIEGASRRPVRKIVVQDGLRPSSPTSSLHNDPQALAATRARLSLPSIMDVDTSDDTGGVFGDIT
jgi:hypothetical protein